MKAIRTQNTYLYCSTWTSIVVFGKKFRLLPYRSHRLLIPAETLQNEQTVRMFSFYYRVNLFRKSPYDSFTPRSFRQIRCKKRPQLEMRIHIAYFRQAGYYQMYFSWSQTPEPKFFSPTPNAMNRCGFCKDSSARDTFKSGERIKNNWEKEIDLFLIRNQMCRWKRIVICNNND